MNNGETVKKFEDALAAYVGARYAIGLNSGTSTLHTALVALGVKPGDRVAVPPLTMAATTIAVLHAGAVPVFVDVDPDTWLMQATDDMEAQLPEVAIPVSLYGLHADPGVYGEWGLVDDAAQTLRPHHLDVMFTSYSFQASKILALGEGGMLVTNDPELARKARAFSSLGYDMSPDTSKIDPATLKHPSYARHHSLGWNYRMSDAVAEKAADSCIIGLTMSESWTQMVNERCLAAQWYYEAIDGCSWITPQHVPDGWTHDYWCYAVALKSAELWEPFTEAIVRHGGEMPYGAWALTYQEPAFQGMMMGASLEGVPITTNDLLGFCPIAEDLQPRLVQLQTNDVQSAQRNADAVAKATREIGG